MKIGVGVKKGCWLTPPPFHRGGAQGWNWPQGSNQDQPPKLQKYLKNRQLCKNQFFEPHFELSDPLSAHFRAFSPIFAPKKAKNNTPTHQIFGQLEKNNIKLFGGGGWSLGLESSWCRLDPVRGIGRPTAQATLWSRHLSGEVRAP